MPISVAYPNPTYIWAAPAQPQPLRWDQTFAVRIHSQVEHPQRSIPEQVSVLRAEYDRTRTLFTIDFEPGDAEAIPNAPAVDQYEAQLLLRRDFQICQQGCRQHGVRGAGVHYGINRAQVAAIGMADAHGNLKQLVFPRFVRSRDVRVAGVSHRRRHRNIQRGLRMGQTVLWQGGGGGFDDAGRLVRCQIDIDGQQVAVLGVFYCFP